MNLLAGAEILRDWVFFDGRWCENKDSTNVYDLQTDFNDYDYAGCRRKNNLDIEEINMGAADKGVFFEKIC